MKKIAFICLFFIISGCSTYQPDETILVQPKVVEQSELPPINWDSRNNDFEFYCEMVISCCGKVEKAKLLTGSGDPLWDSLAQLSLMNWKFDPAIYQGHPIKISVRRKIKVVFDRPIIFSLAEIHLQNYEKADSVYKALLAGADFFLLAGNCSVSDSKIINGNLGNVNIRRYNQEIQNALANLDENEFTKPLGYADHFVIFKRLRLNN